MKKILFLALLTAIVAGSIYAAKRVSPSSRFTNATVVLVNNAGGSYRAVFIKGGETNFQFPASGSTTFSSALPTGVYTLGVAPNGGSSSIRTFSWSIGPDGGSQTGTSATFNNVNVTSGSTITVTIN
jgi:hypothetical protein